MLNEWGPTELYDAEAERNAMYCDACGGYHDGPCPRGDEGEDEEQD